MHFPGKGNRDKDVKETILLIEDEKLMRITIEDALRNIGYEVLSFETGMGAMDALRDVSVNLVITDVMLPDIGGLTLLKQITGLYPETPIIVMTAFGTIQDAIDAIKTGAFDYITKPFSLDEFLLLVKRALDIKRLKEDNRSLRNNVQKCFSSTNIIGESEAMKMVFSLVDKVSLSESNILVSGESGTGKELIANMIHYHSHRKEKRLTKVNCAALPEGLIESELFGHEKGAFTGAIKKKPGRFEISHGGTIFLDEIGVLPHSTQAKLLRVLQERAFERVGGTETVNVDVRIIAATNIVLEEAVKKGAFREDLYYRLNVIPITLPPLRERREDIPHLINFFLKSYAGTSLSNVRFSKRAIEVLMDYEFPGNVRELQNIIERCVTLSTTDDIKRNDLPPFLLLKRDDRVGSSLSDITTEAEKKHIVRVLKMTKGKKTKAAEILGVSRKTLWEKIKAYEIGL